MNITVVHNAGSGSALGKSQLTELFTNAGITVDAFVPIGSAFEDKLRPYIKKDAYIAAIGGDGTLNAVAQVLYGSEAIFVPLPGGTLNHFTKDLGVEQDLTAAIAGIAAGHDDTIDVARANDRLFLNNSSIGIYPSSLQQRARYEKTLGKWPAAVIASIKTFVRWPLFQVEIHNETLLTPFVFIGNNRYDLDEFGGASRHSLQDGSLTVLVAKTASRRAFLKIALKSIFGMKHTSAEFDNRQLKNVTIRTRRTRLSVSLDGELSTLPTPLHYEVIARGLRVRLVHPSRSEQTT